MADPQGGGNVWPPLPPEQPADNVLALTPIEQQRIASATALLQRQRDAAAAGMLRYQQLLIQQTIERQRQQTIDAELTGNPATMAIEEVTEDADALNANKPSADEALLANADGTPEYDPSRRWGYRKTPEGKLVLVEMDDTVRSANRQQTPKSKIPPPPKFDGNVKGEITSIKVWMRDVQRYAQRSQEPLKDMLEVLTTGAARLHIDNMLRDSQTSTMTDDQFAEKFVNNYVQQTQPKDMVAREILHSCKLHMTANTKLQDYVTSYKSVIMDAAPIMEKDSMLFFREGLPHELRAECLTDALKEWNLQT
jgi:hypothetical protein